jgi:HSP20 family molecular chaperone IbpA
LPKSVFTNARALDGVSAALAEAERVIEKTRRDALDLFQARGIIDRAALGRWVSGAREECWHVTDIVERETSFIITIALPGAHAALAESATAPRRLAIRTRSGPGSGASQVLRQLDLPVDLNSERVEAELREGALVITAPKILDC